MANELREAAPYYPEVTKALHDDQIGIKLWRAHGRDFMDRAEAALLYQRLGAALGIVAAAPSPLSTENSDGS